MNFYKLEYFYEGRWIPFGECANLHSARYWASGNAYPVRIWFCGELLAEID